MSDNTSSTQLNSDFSKFTSWQEKLSTSTLLVPLSIASAIMLFIVMNLGIGVSTDSIVFLSAAENLLNHGKIYVTAYGINEPMTHFPPLYPMLLAGLSFIFRCPIETSAKLSGALIFGINIQLVGMILIKCGISIKNAIFAILILAFSEYMIIIHAKVFTEPLFITFMLLGFIFLEKHLRNPQIFQLIIASMCISFACLTRYAGLPLIPLATFALLFFANTAWRSRINSIFIFSIVTLTPLTLWFIRNISLAGTSTNRGISFHPLGIAHIRQLIRSILFVFLPNSVLENIKTLSGKYIMIALVLITLFSLILIYTLYCRLKKYSIAEIWNYLNKMSYMLKILLLFLIVYPAFLVCSISLADYTTPLSYRIMLPEFIIAFPLFIGGLFQMGVVATKKHKKLLSLTLKAILILFLFSYSFRAYNLCSNIYAYGLGYSNLCWQNSKLIKFIKKLPKDTPIYTNGSAGIFYQTKRTPLPIPYKYVNGKPNQNYTKQLEQMELNLKHKHGAIIYFNNIASSLISTPTELQKQFNMKVILQTQDGLVMTMNKINM